MKIDVKKVIKRDGRIVDFDIERIRNAIQKAMMSVNKYDEKTLNKVVRYVVRVLNEKYGEEGTPHVEDIQDIVEFALVRYDLYEVAKAYILYRKEREKIRKEKMLLLNKDYLDEVDKSFSLNSIRLLAARYLLKDNEGKIIESPKQLFQRVALLIVIPDILYDESIYDKYAGQTIHEEEDFNPEEWEGKLGLGYNPETGSFKVHWNRYHLQRMKELYDRLNNEKKMKIPWSKFIEKLARGELDKYYDIFLDYYNLMVTKKFLPNSPTLFNAGTRLGQLSACFVLEIRDDINSIMKAASDAAKIFKTGGGIGINYSNLRPEGDIVSSTAGVASGPVSFMRIIDTVTDVIKQGGRRRGANMGILEIWHPDIEKFITSKSKPGFLENFNISVMITPDFWEAFNQDGEYSLVNPRDGSVWKKIKARQIFRMIAENAWKTGDPGVLFLDNINKHNVMKKYLGEIRSTNPCISGDSRVLTPMGWIRARELYQINIGNKILGVSINSNILGEGGDANPTKTRLLTAIHNEIVYRDRHNKKLKLLVPRDSEGWCWHIGYKRGLHIESKEGYTITVTPEHKFLTPNGWKAANKLNVGDKILVSRIHPAFINQEYKGEYKVDSDVAFALGWLIGKGVFNEEYVAWYIEDDDKIAENRLRHAIHKLGGNPLSHTYMINRTVRKIQYDIGTQVYKNVSNIICKYSGDKNIEGIPEIIWRLAPESLAAFLRGIFTVNGTIDEHNRIKLLNRKIDFLKDIQILLTTFGIYSEITSKSNTDDKNNTTYPYNKISSNEDYNELIISGYSLKLFKDIIGFEDITKMEKLTLQNIDKDSIWITISNIKKLDRVDFYDFTVPKYHNYIANGILNHNCGEEPLYPYESCNLGSINLYALIKIKNGKKYFDWEEYRKVIKLATRFLDNVIDVNQFPLPEIKEKTLSTRKIGLGLMGLADTLFALKVPYNSEEGFWLMSKFAEHLTYYSMEESVELAKERGTFPLYDKSSYVDGEMPIEGYYRKEEWTLDWEKLNKLIMEYGIRNSETTTIAPTGSISMIADTSSGIEPQFALVFEKRVTVGTFFYVDNELEYELKRRGLYSEKLLKKIADNGGSLQDIEEIPEDMKKIFIVAYDIPWWDHVRAQVEISRWICAAVSKTINMPNWVTVEDVEKAYLFAYKLGAKGITIYRDGSKAVQVLVTPSQRTGKYVLEIENNTLKMMQELGIEPPSYAKTTKQDVETKSKIKMPTILASGIEGDGEERYEKCPICESLNIIYAEGCLRCLDCGWSACIIS